MNQSYSELLRDPRWQRKRLTIMQRDKFSCRVCNDDKKTLNVHHCYYERGRAPWDYPDLSLLTMCEDCHEMQRGMDDCAHTFVKMLRSLGVTASDFDCFVASLMPCFKRTEPIGKEIDRAFFEIGKKDLQSQNPPPS